MRWPCVLEKINKCTENASSMFTTSTFHTQVATYTVGSQLEWRLVESGNLPSARASLRAAVVDNVIHVTGGYDEHNYFTSILAWNSSSESWQDVGDLAIERSSHAAVAVPSSMIECCGCSTIFLSATIICSLLVHALFVNDFFRLWNLKKIQCFK